MGLAQLQQECLGETLNRQILPNYTSLIDLWQVITNYGKLWQTIASYGKAIVSFSKVLVNSSNVY